MSNTKEMDMFGEKKNKFAYLVIIQTCNEIEQKKIILEEKITTMKDMEILNTEVRKMYRGDGTILSFHLLENEPVEKPSEVKEVTMEDASFEVKKVDPSNVMV